MHWFIVGGSTIGSLTGTRDKLCHTCLPPITLFLHVLEMLWMCFSCTNCIIWTTHLPRARTLTPCYISDVHLLGVSTGESHWVRVGPRAEGCHCEQKEKAMRHDMTFIAWVETCFNDTEYRLNHWCVSGHWSQHLSGSMIGWKNHAYIKVC